MTIRLTAPYIMKAMLPATPMARTSSISERPKLSWEAPPVTNVGNAVGLVPSDPTIKSVEVVSVAVEAVVVEVEVDEAFLVIEAVVVEFGVVESVLVMVAVRVEVDVISMRAPETDDRKDSASDRAAEAPGGSAVAEIAPEAASDIATDAADRAAEAMAPVGGAPIAGRITGAEEQ